jgi:Protein of unknown function (DUF3602)
MYSHASERPIFSFDEELERQTKMQASMAPVYHIGRGGAGNFASGEGPRRTSAGSEGSSSSSAGSVSGARSSLEGTWHRLRDSFAK